MSINLLLMPTSNPRIASIVHHTADAAFPVAAPLYWVTTEHDAPQPWNREWSLDFNNYLGSKPAPNYEVIPVTFF